MTSVCALVLLAATAEWAYLPPRDVDPKCATLENPIPRRWSGQKAALAFAKIDQEPGKITLSWADAAAARKAPKLKGDPHSLWQGRFPDKSPVTEPRFFAVGKDGRLFRDTLPVAQELLPFVVVVDGNSEDGYGGYVLGCAGGGAWSFAQSVDAVSVSGTGAFVLRFDGTWLAGLQTAARAYPKFFPATEGLSPDFWVTVISEWVQDDDKWNCVADGWGDYLRRRFAARAALLADPRLQATLEKGKPACAGGAGTLAQDARSRRGPPAARQLSGTASLLRRVARAFRVCGDGWSA